MTLHVSVHKAVLDFFSLFHAMGGPVVCTALFSTRLGAEVDDERFHSGRCRHHCFTGLHLRSGGLGRVSLEKGAAAF